MYARACVTVGVCVFGCVGFVVVFMSVFGIAGSWSHRVLHSKRHFSPWTVVCPYRKMRTQQITKCYKPDNCSLFCENRNAICTVFDTVPFAPCGNS